MIKFKMIDQANRDQYRCCSCGEVRSVKYLVPVRKSTITGDIMYYSPYCNKCFALLLNKVTIGLHPTGGII